jgi:hypothetical protein
MAHPFDGLDRLVALAEPLAASWSSRALASTTVGRERAILRAMGVAGLDRDGRPLAWSVVDRWLADMPAGLGGGIALPFAMAMLEYDGPPQSIALDVASGAIELAMEAKLLDEPDRRAAAAAKVEALERGARDRIDANRTARGELTALLGEAPTPGLGMQLQAQATRDALDEAGTLVRGGTDCLRVRVPTGRELAMRLLDLGSAEPSHSDARTVGPAGADPTFGSLGDAGDDPTAVPVGSQRGLAALRVRADELAAKRGAYVRLATAAPALSAPEQAIVAAFERVDLVEADPFAEIVEAGVDPDRALADHAAAHRIHARSGAMLLVGPGPLVVAPDLARGLPSDPATRAGRALALQLLSARFAQANGLEPSAIAVGVLPAWLLGEQDVSTRAVAELTLRRELLPGHPLVIGGPDDDAGPAACATWRHLAALGLAVAPDASLVLHPASTGEETGLDHRAAARVATGVAAGIEPPVLRGAAADHASATIAAATATLERLTGEGWATILGPGPAQLVRAGLGGDAVAERTERLALLDDR